MSLASGDDAASRSDLVTRERPSSRHPSVVQRVLWASMYRPEDEAIISTSTGARSTYRDLASLVGSAARGVLDVPAGRVGLVARNDERTLVDFLANWSVGRSSVLLHPGSIVDEWLAVLEATDAVAIVDPQSASARRCLTGSLQLITPDEVVVDRDASLVPTSPALSRRWDEELVVIPTSGTSGRAKLVCHSAGSRMQFVTSLIEQFGLHAGDRYLAIVPNAHSSGLAFTLAHLYTGGCVVFPATRDAASIWTAVRDERITSLLVVPRLLKRLTAERPSQAEASSLDRIVCMGAPLAPREQVAAEERLQVPVHQWYGASECSFMALLRSEDGHRRLASTVVGRPTPGTFFRVDTAGARGSEGVLEVNSPLVATKIIGGILAPDRGGWMATGDRGFLDDEGFVHVVGRADDTIISGGVNVDPREVEAVLSEHPAIDDVAVLGAESDAWGQEVVALCVTVSAPPSAADLVAYCRGRLAPQKVPKEIVVVPGIPRTPLGKLDRSRALKTLKERH